jgi:hypothetical protein
VPTHNQRLVISALVLLCLLSATAARAGRVSQVQFLSVVDQMVTEWAPRSAHAAASIREEYRPFVELLGLDRFEDIETGLATQGLVPLPQDAARFNIIVRRAGANPIGEKDLARQDSYVSGRAATIGCLLDVASRIKSGPIEVTSLVRHLEYQHELGATNANAMTDVPTHALGIAFDIAMVNTPLATVLELRDVLKQMSDAGDVLVIAEREQLVFHVVPQPSRLGWYADVYARAMNGQAWDQSGDDDAVATPTVIATIGALRPMPAWAAEWWAAENVPVDLQVAVQVHGDDTPSLDRVTTHGILGLSRLGELLSSTWRWLSPVNSAVNSA